MSEKVKITREQANEIEHKKNEIGAIRTIKDHILDYYKDNYALSQKNIDEETLIKAFFIGYEVEEEFKLGDWIYSKYNKDIGIVTEVGSSYLKYDDGFSNELHAFRHATEQEIAQEKKRRFWSRLGRDVEEYREGDIIQDSNKYVVRVDKVVGETIFVVGKVSSNKENCRLICPVEQRLDQ